MLFSMPGGSAACLARELGLSWHPPSVVDSTGKPPSGRNLLGNMAGQKMTTRPNLQTPEQARRVRLSLPTDFAPRELSAYIFAPEVLSRWMGPGTDLQPRLGSVAVIPAGGSGASPAPHLRGEVISVEWSHKGLELIVAAQDPDSGGLRLRITPRPGNRSYVRLDVGGPAGGEIRERLKAWQQILNDLAAMLQSLQRERERMRQAVILVHGIGEQRPGQTLRRFVDGLFPESGGPRYFKPDYASQLLELRTARVPGDPIARRPTTDVYELYWAHLIRDTTLSQVYSWTWRLLITPKDRLSNELQRLTRTIRWSLSILAVVSVCLALFTHGAVIVGVTAAISLLPAVAWGMLRIMRNRFILGFLGDAARYLEPLPSNIAIRQQIREAGGELLEALQRSDRYSRVILYGHSLGSVIAYDMLCHSWAHRSREHSDGVVMTSRALAAVENLLNPRTPTREEIPIEEIQDRQHDAFRESRRNGFNWRISDFVTAGSPLTHASALLALDKNTSFDDLVAQRVYATCPPQTEEVTGPRPGTLRKSFTFVHSYPDPSGHGSRSVLVPHHAGLFALTRWCNLYFPVQSLVTGDPVGGAVRDVLGHWVRDVRLVSPRGRFAFAHNWYTRKGREGAEMHIDKLRKALSLESSADLFDLDAARLRREERLA
jgi:hypothetical protein